MTLCVQCGRSLEQDAADCAWCDGTLAAASSTARRAGAVELGREPVGAPTQRLGPAVAEPADRFTPQPAGSPASPKAAPREESQALLAVDSAEFEPRRTSSWPPRPVEAPQRATPTGLQAARPPVLASDILRSDLSPATPAVQRVRVSLAVLGLFGFAAAMLLVGPLAFGAVIGGAFAGLAALGVVLMAYQARAAATAAIAGVGLAVTTWNRLQHGAELEAVVLLMGVTLLATALVFRGWHRGSPLARMLVAIGIAVCATWLATSGRIEQLVAPGNAWQAWLGPAVALTLVAVLMLSLLAFMDARSTGGCGVWAGVLLGWYTLYTWSGLLTLYWPAQESAFVVQRVNGDFGLTLLATPIFACVLALGLSQLLAVASAASSVHGLQRPK